MQVSYLDILEKAKERNLKVKEVFERYGISNYEIVYDKNSIIKLKMNNLSKIIYIKNEKDILSELQKLSLDLKLK